MAVASNTITYSFYNNNRSFTTLDPFSQNQNPTIRLSERDLRAIADELTYNHPNSRWRGIHPRDLQEVVEVVARFITHGGDQRNFEDLFHQAMACLEAAYEGEEVEGDAAELLNKWSSILTGG